MKKNALFEMNIPQNTEELPQTKIKWVCKGEVFFSAMIGDSQLSEHKVTYTCLKCGKDIFDTINKKCEHSVKIGDICQICKRDTRMI